eukprot:Nk52_evm42s207 gene=Nk52_evmTU42s207
MGNGQMKQSNFCFSDHYDEGKGHLNLCACGLKSIPKKAFQLQIKKIKLSDNRLSSLPTHNWEQLKELTYLSLSGNALSKIPSSFGSLEQLSFLSLRDNGLKEIPVVLFELPRLTTLNLSHNSIRLSNLEHANASQSISLCTLDVSFNEITFFPPELGQALKGLKVLDISHNRLESAKNIFENMAATLEEIDLSYNFVKLSLEGIETCTNMKSVAACFNLLENMSHILSLRNLNHIDVSHNYIAEWYSTSVEGVSLVCLREFVASHNALKEIPFPVLSPSIKFLRIDNNHIVDVPQEEMSRCSALEELYLSGNCLTQLPCPLPGLPLCIALDVSHNKIREIAVGSFEGLRNLRHLDLSSNCISVFDCFDDDVIHHVEYLSLANNLLTSLPQTIGNLILIQSLDLSNNQISNCPESILNLTTLKNLNLTQNHLLQVPLDFSECEDLKELYIGYNDRNFKCPPHTLPQSCTKLVIGGMEFDSLMDNLEWSSLQELYLTKGTLKEMGKVMHCLSNLKVLDLCCNNISSIPSFEGLVNLNSLSLSMNKIESISDDAFDNNKNLWHVNLSHNELTEISTGIAKLSCLVHLDVSFNHIKSVPMDFESDKLVMLNMESNPLSLRLLNKSRIKKKTLYWLHLVGDKEKGNFGRAYTIGKKDNQEDTTFIGHGIKDDDSTAFLGVFDGHAGNDVSIFAAKKFIKLFRSKLFRNSKASEFASAVSFEKQFENIQKDIRKRNMTGGSTAVIAFVKNGYVQTAHVGDSRAVLGYLKPEAVADVNRLTKDHKPYDRDEYARIKQRGGFLEKKRLNGALGVSRSLGDLDLGFGLSHIPECSKTQILQNQDTSFVILASDGLWDVVDDCEAIKIVREEVCRTLSGSSKYSSHCNTAAKCALLLRDIAFARGSADNISVIVGLISKTSDGDDNSVPSCQPKSSSVLKRLFKGRAGGKIDDAEATGSSKGERSEKTATIEEEKDSIMETDDPRDNAIKSARALSNRIDALKSDSSAHSIGNSSKDSKESIGSLERIDKLLNDELNLDQI